MIGCYRRSAAIGSVLALLAILVPAEASACGGCYRLPYQSLLEKVERGDRVVVAQPSDPNGTTWVIDRTIKGGAANASETIQIDKQLGRSTTNTSGSHILIWSRTFNSWTNEARANEELAEFLSVAASLSTPQRLPLPVRQQAQRLRFFLPYLEHADAKIADSTHARIAGAPYAVLKEVAADLDRDKLLVWIENHSAAINTRVALFVTLLGLCGNEQDARQIKNWIDQTHTGGEVSYLTALLTAHIEMEGDQAVSFIE